MTTLTEAKAAIRARLEANFTAIALRWPNEGETIPDEPAPFAFTEVIAEDAFYAGFGGGRGANLQRTPGRIECHILAARGTGTEDGEGWAEDICALFRSYRDGTISCFAAEVFPPLEGPPFTGGAAGSGNYKHVATAVIDFHFDRTG